ncbi:MAG: type II toxin-antitoxin system ParD family antitoxin [Acidobacteria bacterium]|nr:type II toxin-antitoxin system ParD family antitoxin [Acidobacteriota bacterium]MCH8267754.1 type II toxin-antitoxin system ParD family antitoxin [Acidobacteriota bacterium]MCZ6490435.1 type II toxin-antitoxin system ParD family antitoxin [Acidobacteriota bacterium]MCZ6751297.1 type II toxin-antitoxin system ParD family antitoxin [Acidobacteriota bacterium]
METMNISLPETMKQFIEEQVSAGGYSSVSEYIRALVREEQKRKAQEQLEALLVEGLESGKPTEMTDEEWNEIRRESLARLKARKSA